VKNLGLLRSLIFLLLLSSSLLAQELKLTRVTPQGKDVPPPSQIIFEFDREMVPLGRMERGSGEIPITITPKLECEWRWIDTRSLACYLSEQHKASSATNYQIAIEADFTALDGAKLAGPIATGFATSRAKIQYYWLREWSSPGTPAISLTFTEPVDRESAEQRLFFEVEGRRYPAALLQPEGYRDNISFLVAPLKELPLDSDIKLRVLPGIRSLKGKEPSNDERVVLEFRTFPRFSLVGLSCRNNQQQIIRADLGGECDSLAPVSLLFSAPADLKTISQALKIGGSEVLVEESYPRRFGNVQREYPVSLPLGLKPATEFELKLTGSLLRDEFGRALDRDYQIKFRTADRLPRLVIPKIFSTLESEEETHLPVAIQNLTKLEFNFDALTKDGLTLNRRLELSPPFVKNVSWFYPLKIRQEVPNGVVFGSLTGPELMSAQPVLTQVTPFAMHLKQGHRNSTLWVTRLSDGSPVRRAEVSVHRLYPDGRLNSLSPALHVARTDRSGVAELPGTAEIDPKNLSAFSLLECRAGCDEHVEALVYLVKGDDGEIGMLPATSDFELDPHSAEYIYQSGGQLHDYIKSWGMTAQGVYRPGDKVEYKIFVREEFNQTLGQPPEGRYSLKVYDPLGAVVHERERIELSDFGSFSGDFLVAKNAVVGKYRFELKPDYSQTALNPLEVLVSEFTPAQFRVESEIESGQQALKVGSDLALQVKASLYAGGPYASAPVRVTGRIQAVYDPELPEVYKGFNFDLYRHSTMEENFTAEARLNERGEIRVQQKIAPSNILYGKLRIESSVSDDRGRYISNEKVVPFAAKDRFVGLRTKEWLMRQGKPFLVEGGVVDADLNAVAGERFEIEVFRVERVAHRVKGPGNAWLTQYGEEERQVRKCELISGEAPAGCSVVPVEAGEYRLKARVEGGHTSTLTSYAVGEGAVVWSSGEDHGLEIIPENKSYKVGDVARFLVKNPLPGALALITTERIGVITREVRKLKGAVSVVEVKVTEDHIPGFFLSVVLHSPRVDKPVEGDVDFGKPLVKSGYAKVKVDSSAKSLKFSVKSDRESYRPAEEVNLELRSAEQVEFAVAVVDEAVFDLLRRGISAYDPLAGFYQLGGLDLRNFNALLTLVGKRKFEKKGASSGGDGAREEDLRELERFIAFWTPELVVRGKKTVRFKLPEGNLTSWKVIAVAADRGGSRFGVAETKFRSTKPLEIAAAMPNFLREGDSFKAKFTLLNRSEDTRKVQLLLPGRTESVELAPFRREQVQLELKGSGEEVTIPISASGGGEFYDGLKVKIPVLKNSLVLNSASYRRLIDEETRVPLEVPADVSEPQLSVKLSLTLLSNLDPLFSSMRDYPYGCFEQQLSKAITAANFLLLKSHLGISWDESASVLNEFLGDLSRFQSEGGGFSYFGSADRVDPYLSAYAALVFNWLEEAGHLVPETVEQRLHGYLERFLKEDVQPGFYTSGMSSSVRAVALNVLSSRGKAGVKEVERYFGRAPEMTLFGKANLLIAAVRSGARKELIEELVRQIRAHGEESGGKLSFQERQISAERILASSLRDNCMILLALLQKGNELSASTKLATHIVEALRSPNTQESVFCSRALVDFQRLVEGEPKDAEVSVSLGAEILAKQIFSRLRDRADVIQTTLKPGAQELRTTSQGGSAVYQTVTLSYAENPVRLQGVNSGIEIVREYSVQRGGHFVPVTELKPGEIVRVNLFLRLPAPRSFVVVDDPLPAALEAVNRDLATSSEADADKADDAGGSFYFQFDDWRGFASDVWSFYHRELKKDSVRFYSEYLPAGNYHLSYVAQVIAEGSFFAPSARAFEMYHEETYGLTKSDQIVVK
jgi:uncharacterized protein YfaS (alpha-2-macroglobulin family)